MSEAPYTVNHLVLCRSPDPAVELTAEDEIKSPIAGRNSVAEERFTRSILTCRQAFFHWGGLVIWTSKGRSECGAAESLLFVCVPARAITVASISGSSLPSIRLPSEDRYYQI